MCSPGAHDSFCSSGVFKKILNNFLEFTFFFTCVLKTRVFLKCFFLCILFHFTLLSLILGGSNKMHEGKNYQDFLKWEVVFRSFSYNN